MTFAQREESRSLGAPVSLYLFRYGPDSYFAYTDAEQPILAAIPGLSGAPAFEPVPIARDEITNSGSLDRASLSITLDDGLDLCLLFSQYPPSDVVTLSVYEGHIGDDDFKGVWFGRVIAFGSDGAIKAQLTCEPVATSLKRPGLRRCYQYGCPHPLYGNQCRASRPAATITLTAQALAGSLINVGDGWSANFAKYVGGIAEWQRSDGRFERRTILQSASDGTITLAGPAFGLAAGMDVDLSLGCNHQMSDCADLHDNIHNFGGQPWIPTKNPIGLTNNFY